MISLPKDTSHWQQRLSTLNAPVTLPKDLFVQMRPLVCSVYAPFNKNFTVKSHN